MFKRYMPLLFVLLVVVATALFYLLFRGTGAPDTSSARPAMSRPATAPRTGDDGITEFRIESEEEYQLALEALGTSNDDIEAWARSRGFPPATYTSSPGMPLERNYRSERDARLLELAEEGDVWAMQILAARIASEMPLEAIDWYRKAVVHGSAFAAFQLGSLYQEIARWVVINQDGREEVLEIVQREDPLAHSALAWLLVAEYEAGLPPGAMSATLAGFQSPDDAILDSCNRAATVLAEIHAQRETLGVTVVDQKPPLAIELPPEETAGYCPADVFPHADFSGCETIRLLGNAGAVIGHRCR